MTPYETAMRFMRQRETTTSHPDFIVAYLLEEASHTQDGNPLRLSPHFNDRMRFTWGDLKDAFLPFVRLFRQVGDAAATASVEMQRLREATEAGRQFQAETADQLSGESS